MCSTDQYFNTGPMEDNVGAIDLILKIPFYLNSPTRVLSDTGWLQISFILITNYRVVMPFSVYVSQINVPKISRMPRASFNFDHEIFTPLAKNMITICIEEIL